MLAVLSILAAEGGEAEKVINPVIPEIPEMVWGAIAFFALLILMNWVALPPLRQAMAKREEQLRGDDEAAERASVEAEQVRRDYDATLAEARAEAGSIVDAARQKGEAQRAELVRVAEADVAALRQSAMAELSEQRSAALTSMRGDVATLAVSAASKVIQRPLEVSANQATVDAAVSAAGTDA